MLVSKIDYIEKVGYVNTLSMIDSIKSRLSSQREKYRR